MFDVCKLRDDLFASFFNITEGIKLETLMNSLKSVTEVWQKLHSILERDLEGFHKLSSIMGLKTFAINNKHFLVLKAHLLTYLIIDLDNDIVLSKKETLKYFKEDTLITKFGELKSSSKAEFQKMFTCLEYKGDITNLVDFIIENYEILSLPTHISYTRSIGEARASINIHLNDRVNILAFRTPNQELYEHLFFDNNLVPLGMQDAGAKIGYDKMKEMFNSLKDIVIPSINIPDKMRQFIGESLDESRK